jgi:uncharacterized protein YecT (DUF1311 family)
MKSAYELAMERLSKTEPARKLTAAQKAEIAEVDSQCTARLAQAELALKDELAAAAEQRDYEKADEARRRFSIDRAKIEEDREARKQRIRDGK